MLKVASFLLVSVIVVSGCVGTPTSSPTQSSPATTAPTATASAELGSIEGTVVDEEGLPISGADIGIPEPSLKAQTDAAGKFVFNDMTPGDYNVFAAKLGFASGAKKVSVIAGEVAAVTIALNAISTTNASFHLAVPYEGYIECSVSAFSPVNCAGATDQTSNSWIVDVDRTYPLKEVVIELVWTQSSPASGTEMEIEFCDDLENRQVLCASNQVDGYYVYADGPSPVVLRVTNVPEDATQLLLGAGAKFQSQPIVQQRFTEYITWCYVEKCTDDYSALPPS